MEKVHEGWLTKSPPDWKKHVSIFKLKKWRRRYFVLYSPPDSCIIPGNCDAQLCYYENESLSKECGRIDLKSCEEIISQLETDDFKNVLALRTVFRNQSRIYYLAADTEEDLERWMDKISYLLNISGDEFIEVNQNEEAEMNKKVSCRSKVESKSRTGDKPRNKLSGVSLRRSSSTLSKSSTSINLLAVKQNRTLPGHSPVFSPSVAGKYQKITGSQSDCLSLSIANESSEFDLTFMRGSAIRSKPSFLSKIKQLKSPSRRPSCPLIMPQPSYTVEESAAANVLRPNASKQNPMRFQGSSGSSIISFNSDYKTPDISSPTMPPLFYFKKFDMTEASLKMESKFSLLSSLEPPPLPPKIRSSDSGLPDETNAPINCPIYDIPAHNYGSYKEDAEDVNDDVDPGYIKDRLVELEGMTRFEGICLSVVDEREDEGLENDRCPSLEEQVLESIPPPLPVRRKPCLDKTSRNSSDSEYDVLPFARRLMTDLNEFAKVPRPKAETSDDDSRDSDDNYDFIPARMIVDRDDLEPPPLPERKRLNNVDRSLGMSMGDRSSDSVDDFMYDRIVNEGGRLSDDDILADVLAKDQPQKADKDGKLFSSHLAKNLLLPRNRLLVRMKSKSMENIKEKASELSSEESRKSTVEEAKIVRATLKTRSFKRKSGDTNKFDESISSLNSSSSPSIENPEPLIVNDSSIY